MKKLTKNSFLDWYEAVKPDLARLQARSTSIVETELSAGSIEFLRVESRLKEAMSAWRKQLTKGYSDPRTEITDFVGLRIIVFLETDIDRVADIVRTNFVIDEKNSVDKRLPTSVETVGYRSLHLVCSLGTERERFSEYKGIGKANFEVQIRTMLQHTWAEIEHKRNYKSKDSLPSELQHRLMVLAGTLELIDREFAQIGKEAEEYRAQLESEDLDTQDDQLSELSVDVVISTAANQFDLSLPALSTGPHASTVMDELRDYGLVTVEDFVKLVSRVNLEPVFKEFDGAPDGHAVGLIRDLMIVDDPDRYFEDAFKGRFGGMSSSDLIYLSSASGRTDLESLFEANGVELYDDGDEFA